MNENSIAHTVFFRMF